MKKQECAKDIVIEIITELYKIDLDLVNAVLPYLDDHKLAERLMKHCCASIIIMKDVVPEGKYEESVINFIEDAIAYLLIDPNFELIDVQLS